MQTKKVHTVSDLTAPEQKERFGDRTAIEITAKNPQKKCISSYSKSCQNQNCS